MYDHALHALDVAGLWPMMSALFLTGLVGGFGHCTSMCGPFVLAQVGGSVSARPDPQGTAVMTRAGRGVLVPYHLGRLTTYAALGGLAGGLSGLVVRATEFQWILVAFLLLAAAMFLIQGLKGLSRWLPALGRIPTPGGDLVHAAARMLSRPLRPLFADPGGANGYALGLALGFLPCGFLYAALASSVGTGSAVGGVAVMAAFAAGTMPSLMAVGILGSVAGSRWMGLISTATPALMLFNAGVLVVMAGHALG